MWRKRWSNSYTTPYLTIHNLQETVKKKYLPLVMSILRPLDDTLEAFHSSVTDMSTHAHKIKLRYLVLIPRPNFLSVVCSIIQTGVWKPSLGKLGPNYKAHLIQYDVAPIRLLREVNYIGSDVQVCHQRLSGAFDLFDHCSLIQTLTLTPPPSNALPANMDM